MDATACPLARYARTEARLRRPGFAAVLVDDETKRHELAIRIDDRTGVLFATLLAGDTEATGSSRVVLSRPSKTTATAVATVLLIGYDPEFDHCLRHEATLGVTWSIVAADGAVEVAGTALLTNLDRQRVTTFRAVRDHPFNRIPTTAGATAAVAFGREPAATALDAPKRDGVRHRYLRRLEGAR